MSNQVKHQYAIAFGSNMGDRLNYISKALDYISEEVGPILKNSTLYESEPIGAADQSFINGAILVESTTTPIKVMEKLLDIEKRLGRERSIKWGNRTIDLDIILIEKKSHSIQFNSDVLMVPHPEAKNRDFVMVPISEVVGDWRFYPLAQTCSQYCLTAFKNSNLKPIE